MHEAWWLWLIPGFPLIGSALCGALHFRSLAVRRAGAVRGTGAVHHAAAARHADDAYNLGPAPFAAGIAIAAMAGSLVLSLVAFMLLLGEEPEGRLLASPVWHWIHTGNFAIDVHMIVDPLSSLMTLIVTGVGSLIHVYAASYMKGDRGYAKFFAYFNLFAAAMLILVLSSSLLGLFIGWEGVGLCSYLLIGFWYEKMPNSEAGQKAFIVNRIGDACFLVGAFILATTLGTLDMAAIGAAVPEPGLDPATSSRLALAALLLFAGACGKSAQLPLFVWLPDAMAGPTPVSALIHAATMVTAGVYLVVRLNPLFASSPELLLFIGTVAALTAFIAGTTALVQRDIKRVLAYSTVSQLGFMFLALGSGAWVSAIFHLTTHAFFKALLFLGAGSVIHGMHEEQDMHRMGGLKRHMPRTFVTFVVGAAALSGLPLMSGYFSKDEILAHTLAVGGPYWVLWIVGLATAALTAFYTWRMVALTFFGKERFDAAHVHPHESPVTMTTPLVALAVLSALGGLLGLPAVFGVPHLLHDWLEPVVARGNALLHAGTAEHEISHALEWVLLGLGAVVALYFSHRAFHAHRHGVEVDEALARKRPALFDFLGDAWGIDSAYRSLIVQPVKLLSLGVSVLIDQFAIDGMVNGAAALTRSFGRRVRRMADGSIATYGLWMGAVAVVLVFLWSLGGER